jgi:isoleucyl-tRNA synthetase
LASDGKKMSKRLKNYPDPMEITKKYGADSLRYYLLMSGASAGEPLKFNDSEVCEVLQKVILPLTNSLSFFNEYLKNFQMDNKFDLIESTRPFDKWIMKKLYDFIHSYSELLNSYKINPISYLLSNFINALNDSYIRLNRNVFKGKDDIMETQMALSTLHNVLYILSVYLSPILPFLSETIYQELSIDSYEKPISVHLMNIKSINMDKYNVDDDDYKMIDFMFDIINMVRKVRSGLNIQVRRPLKLVQIFGDDDKIELLKKVESYITNEVNILDLEYKKWEATTYKYVYTINNSVAGKLFRQNKGNFEKFMKTVNIELGRESLGLGCCTIGMWLCAILKN